MKRSMFLLFLSLCLTAARTSAKDAERVKEIGFDQKLNITVPLGLEFCDEDGKRVKLQNYFGDKPVILALVYYQCPMLCNQVMNGIERSLNAVAPRAGTDFQVITVSIDPSEPPKLAAEKKRNYALHADSSEIASGWHCLTGTAEAIRRLTKAVGFRYYYDERLKQYAHAAGFVVLTPMGRISRYFFGIDYSPSELQSALSVAAKDQTGTLVHELLLLCYDYDPATGKYGLAIMKTLRFAGGVTALTLITAIIVMIRRDQRRASRSTVRTPEIVP